MNYNIFCKRQKQTCLIILTSLSRAFVVCLQNVCLLYDNVNVNETLDDIFFHILNHYLCLPPPPWSIRNNKSTKLNRILFVFRLSRNRCKKWICFYNFTNICHIQACIGSNKTLLLIIHLFFFISGCLFKWHKCF